MCPAKAASKLRHPVTMTTSTGSRGQAALTALTRRIRCWAHRGAGKTAPENTLIAIREGARCGFTAVEFDTMPTADGQWILHHDWVPGRTVRPRPDSNGPSVAGKGSDGQHSVRRMLDLSASELAQHEAGSWLDERFAGEPVPLLADALRLCFSLGMEVNVELKLDMDSGVFTDDRLSAAARSLLDVLQASPYGQGLTVEQGAEIPAGQTGSGSSSPADSKAPTAPTSSSSPADRLIVSSFGLQGLYALRAAGYAGRIAPLFEVLSDDWVVHARDLQAEAIHTDHSQASPEWVRRVHTTGRAFRVYTVNDADRLQALDAMGVDDCFTDNMGFAAA